MLAFPLARQNDGHGLRVNGPDKRVGVSCKEGIKPVLALDGACLRPPHTRPRTPQAGKEEERALLIQGEPDRRLARLGVGIFTEGRDRHEAAKFRFEPRAPEGRGGVADIGHGRIANIRRRWEALAHHAKFPHAILSAD